MPRTKKKPTLVMCAGCWKQFPVDEMTVNENGSPRCLATCLPPKASMRERWDDIRGYAGLYKVSTFGRVKSVDRKVNHRHSTRFYRSQYITPIPHKDGYLSVLLSKNGRKKRHFVHKLVLETFVGRCPDGQEARHFPDRSKLNNRLDNLSYATHKQNMRDQITHGTRPRGSDVTHLSKLTDQDIADILNLSKTKTLEEIGRIYGVSKQAVCAIVNGKTWTHVTKIGWYVLAVEPGREFRVKKELVRKSKIENLTNEIKRIIIPKLVREEIVPIRGHVVAEGEAPDPRSCHLHAQAKCRELAGVQPEEDYSGYRYSVFRPKGKEAGRESNNWAWKVKTVPEGKESKILERVKYPGYLICHLTYTPEVKAVIDKLRGSWGLLLKPVTEKCRVQIVKSQTTGMFRWKLRSTGTNEVVDKGGPYADRARCVSEADKAKARVEEFKPTALKSKEEAVVLLEQKILNQLKADRAAREARHVSVRKGDLVRITGGAFRDVTGKVVGIDKSDPAAPLVQVAVEVLGHPLTVAVPHNDVVFAPPPKLKGGTGK